MSNNGKVNIDKQIQKIAYGIYRELKNYNAHWADHGGYRREFSVIMSHWSYMPTWAQNEAIRADSQDGYKYRTSTSHYRAVMYCKISGSKRSVRQLLDDMMHIPF